MMAYTTRDFRYLARLITRRTLLYTEMVVAPAVIHGDRDR
ncbi:MAG TPA: tRNA dihydrouridine(20/20a) synthase DusA, partial [Alcanivorax sp.]|nr:tRNA dihydrouridine(20/20a) synthase DusA [Alcanivorax sp.]